MDDAAVKTSPIASQFHGFTPSPDFISGFLRLLHQRFPAPAGDNRPRPPSLWARWGPAERGCVGEILQIGQRLALAADEPAGIVRFHVEQQAVVQFVLYHRGREVQQTRGFFRPLLWVARAEELKIKNAKLKMPPLGRPV